MSARRVQGDYLLSNGLPVATAQAVEQHDNVALISNTIVRASDTAWASAVATPSAPTLANAAVALGSPLTNALTGVKVSAQFPWGEGALSAAATATPTAAAAIKCTLAALPTAALWWNIYVETAAGSGTYQYWGKSDSGAILMIDSYGTGRVPPTAVLSDATTMTQYNFCVGYVGASNQRKITNLARIFGNSEDNKIIVCRGGVFEFDCASASFNVGDYVGPAKDTGNTLMDQTVVAVAGEALAIGRVFEKATSVTKVKVELLSRFVAERIGVS